MKNKEIEPNVLHDVIQDLTEIGCPTMAAKLNELYRSPSFLDLSPINLIQEIVTPEYEEKMSVRLNGRIKRANLVGCNATLDKCRDSNERSYQPVGVADMLRSLNFVEDGLNVCILGPSGSGKSYFAKALALQGCQSMRVEYHHCETLLCGLAEAKGIAAKQYQKRLRALANLDLVVLDDFLLQAIDNRSQLSILFDLLERRIERHHSTIVCSQRNPESWPTMMGGDTAMADAILNRVARGYTVVIEMNKRK